MSGTFYKCLFECLNPCIFFKNFTTQQNLCSNDESETCCWLSYDMFYPLQHIALEWKEMDPYVNITTSNIYYDFFCGSHKMNCLWWAKLLHNFTFYFFAILMFVHVFHCIILPFTSYACRKSNYHLFCWQSIMILGLMWY